jgi:hypothetical protein
VSEGKHEVLFLRESPIRGMFFTRFSCPLVRLSRMDVATRSSSAYLATNEEPTIMVEIGNSAIVWHQMRNYDYKR